MPLRLLGTDWNFWPDQLSPASVWETCAALGFAGMELGVYRAADGLSPSRTTALRSLQAEHGLKVEAVLYSMPPERWPGGGLASPVHGPTAVRDAIDAAGRAADMGAVILGIWPGADAPDAPDGWARTADRLGDLAQAASELGIAVAVEPKPGQVLATTDDAVRLCEELDHPSLGVLLDTGHALAAGENLGSLPDRVGRHLSHLHLGDSTGDADADLPPGSHHDFTLFFSRLLAGGYRGAASFDLYGAVQKGPSGPSERETKGPSGPSERETKGPSGPSERETKGRLTGKEASRRGLAHVRIALGVAAAP